MRVLFDTDINATDGPLVTVDQAGDYIISAVSGGSLGGGSLAVKLYDSSGNEVVTPCELTYSALPAGHLVTLGKGWGVRAMLTGATTPSLKLGLSKAK